MLERRTHLIDVAYAVKGFITEKLVKLDNVCYFLKQKTTETGSNRPVSVRFGFLEKNRFKPV
jgi:hypothetical protein